MIRYPTFKAQDIHHKLECWKSSVKLTHDTHILIYRHSSQYKSVSAYHWSSTLNVPNVK